MRGLQHIGSILKDTVVEWMEDDIPARGAALSYYVILSLGPVLVLVVAGLEFFLESARARAEVVAAVRDNVGMRAAETASVVLERVDLPNLLAPESIFALALVLFGATAAFANIRGSLNTIWGVDQGEMSKREIAKDLLRARVRGVLMILVTGGVLTLSFVFTAVAGLVDSVLTESVIFGSFLVHAIDAGVSFLLTGLLFGAIYRTLPALRIEWSTVWIGAFATALLFVVGKSLVAWLISSASWTSYYGPGASVVAFLAWIYFSAQIFFLGAEFTQVWSRYHGGVMSEAT